MTQLTAASTCQTCGQKMLPTDHMERHTDLLREACAKICEEQSKFSLPANLCAAAIRASIQDAESVAATVRDAERYRWLKKPENGWHVMEVYNSGTGDACEHPSHLLDAAIDAALKAEG